MEVLRDIANHRHDTGDESYGQVVVDMISEVFNEMSEGYEVNIWKLIEIKRGNIG